MDGDDTFFLVRIMETMLITGGNGRLGQAMKVVFKDALFPSYSELDINDRNKVFSYIKENEPDILIHLAAKTSIRDCDKNKKSAWNTNVGGTENIVDAIQEYCPSCYFVYCSTACVFRGGSENYSEDSTPDPCSYYALTKLVGEYVSKRIKNHLVFRTNFVPRQKWEYEKAFTDRFGTYLFADDLARAIKGVISKKINGTVHICGDKKYSMFELAKITTPDIKPITLDEYEGPALAKDMSLVSNRIKPYSLSTKGYDE
jgi:dTDP-4-dehydrorhamnose reductase